MCIMKLTTDQEGTIILEQVFNSVILKSSDGEKIAICMRDSGFEFAYNNVNYSAKEGIVKPMTGMMIGSKVQHPHHLYNYVIADMYKNGEWTMLPSEFIGAFAYWVSSHSNFKFSLDKVLSAFIEFINEEFENVNAPEIFSFKELKAMLSEKEFMKIPELLILNTEYGIDLEVLASNIFFMVLREQITQPL